MAESHAFAKIVAKAGYTFIGPNASVLELMGDKIAAKKFMTDNDIPVLPGSEEAIASTSDLKKIAQSIGFPVILKAAAGGGGGRWRLDRGGLWAAGG